MNFLKKIVAVSLLIGIGYGIYRFVSCSSSIKTIVSYNQVSALFQSLDNNALVLFDVDDTLIMPADKSMWGRIIEKNQAWLKELADETLKRAKHPEGYYTSIWKMQSQVLLIEPQIVKMINALQERGIKVMALTALDTGSYYTIPSLPQWRFDTLQSLGIDFSKAHFDNMKFQELPSRDGNYPILFNGILCTSSASKGAVLGAFLNRIRWKPSHIIYFDDSLKRVKQVQEEACKRSIPFLGFQYLGAEHVPGALDKEVAQLQQNYLIDHEKWLSESEARVLLEKERGRIPHAIKN